MRGCQGGVHVARSVNVCSAGRTLVLLSRCDAAKVDTTGDWLIGSWGRKGEGGGERGGERE